MHLKVVRYDHCAWFQRQLRDTNKNYGTAE
jgi:hypothetical protein